MCRATLTKQGTYFVGQAAMMLVTPATLAVATVMAAVAWRRDRGGGW